MDLDTLPLPIPALAGAVGVWCTGEEFLRVTSAGIAFGARVQVNFRFQEYGRATPQVSGEPHTPADDRSVVTSDIPLGTGWLQGLTAFVGVAAPAYGELFVRVDLMRGRGAGATLVQTLVQGPITVHMRRTWPPAALVPTLESAGVLRSVAGTNPAAGAEISETVPAGTRWRLRTMTFELVTDATVANREISFTIDDGATILFAGPSGFSQTASLTRRYSASPSGGGAAPTVAPDRLFVIADLELPAAARIRTVTTNLQAGDNFGAPQLLVEERLVL